MTFPTLHHRVYIPMKFEERYVHFLKKMHLRISPKAYYCCDLSPQGQQIISHKINKFVRPPLSLFPITKLLAKIYSTGRYADNILTDIE